MQQVFDDAQKRLKAADAAMAKSSGKPLAKNETASQGQAKPKMSPKP
jgi:hypothetical protein